MNCEVFSIDFKEQILHEIQNKKMKQKDIAQTYVLLLVQAGSGLSVDWREINKAIIERWSVSGLTRIKNMAHSGKCFE